MKEKGSIIALIICIIIIALLSLYIVVDKINTKDDNNINNDQPINNNQNNNNGNNSSNNNNNDNIKTVEVISATLTGDCEDSNKTPITITDKSKIDEIEKVYNTAKVISNPQGLGGACSSTITLNYSDGTNKNFDLGGANVLYINSNAYEATYVISGNVNNTTSAILNFFK